MQVPDALEASHGGRAAILLQAVIERSVLVEVHANPCILVDASPELVEALMLFQSAIEDLETSHDAEDGDPAEHDATGANFV